MSESSAHYAERRSALSRNSGEPGRVGMERYAARLPCRTRLQVSSHARRSLVAMSRGGFKLQESERPFGFERQGRKERRADGCLLARPPSENEARSERPPDRGSDEGFGHERGGISCPPVSNFNGDDNSNLNFRQFRRDNNKKGTTPKWAEQKSTA